MKKIYNTILDKLGAISPISHFINDIFQKFVNHYIDTDRQITVQDLLKANELKDLPLAVNKINKEHLSNAPYILHKAIIKKLKVKVPGLGSITKNPIEITISGLEVVLKKNKQLLNKQFFTNNYQKQQEQDMFNNKNTKNQNRAFVDSDSEDSQENEDYQPNHFKMIIKQIISNIKINLENIQISILNQDPIDFNMVQQTNYLYKKMMQDNIPKPQNFLLLQIGKVSIESVKNAITQEYRDSQAHQIQIQNVSLHLLKECEKHKDLLDHDKQYLRLIDIQHKSTLLAFEQNKNIEITIQQYKQIQQQQMQIDMKIPQTELMVTGIQLKTLQAFINDYSYFQQQILKKVIQEQLRQQSEQKRREFNQQKLTSKFGIKRLFNDSDMNSNLQINNNLSKQNSNQDDQSTQNNNNSEPQEQIQDNNIKETIEDKENIRESKIIEENSDNDDKAPDEKDLKQFEDNSPGNSQQDNQQEEEQQEEDEDDMLFQSCLSTDQFGKSLIQQSTKFIQNMGDNCDKQQQQSQLDVKYSNNSKKKESDFLDSMMKSFCSVKSEFDNNNNYNFNNNSSINNSIDDLNFQSIDKFNTLIQSSIQEKPDLQEIQQDLFSKNSDQQETNVKMNIQVEKFIVYVYDDQQKQYQQQQLQQQNYNKARIWSFLNDNKQQWVDSIPSSSYFVFQTDNLFVEQLNTQGDMKISMNSLFFAQVRNIKKPNLYSYVNKDNLKENIRDSQHLCVNYILKIDSKENFKAEKQFNDKQSSQFSEYQLLNFYDENYHIEHDIFNPSQPKQQEKHKIGPKSILKKNKNNPQNQLQQQLSSQQSTGSKNDKNALLITITQQPLIQQTHIQIETQPVFVQLNFNILQEFLDIIYPIKSYEKKLNNSNIYKGICPEFSHSKPKKSENFFEQEQEIEKELEKQKLTQSQIKLQIYIPLGKIVMENFGKIDDNQPYPCMCDIIQNPKKYKYNGIILQFKNLSLFFQREFTNISMVLEQFDIGTFQLNNDINLQQSQPLFNLHKLFSLQSTVQKVTSSKQSSENDIQQDQNSSSSGLYQIQNCLQIQKKEVENNLQQIEATHDKTAKIFVQDIHFSLGIIQFNIEKNNSKFLLQLIDDLQISSEKFQESLIKVQSQQSIMENRFKAYMSQFFKNISSNYQQSKSNKNTNQQQQQKLITNNTSFLLDYNNDNNDNEQNDISDIESELPYNEQSHLNQEHSNHNTNITNLNIFIQNIQFNIQNSPEFLKMSEEPEPQQQKQDQQYNMDISIKIPNQNNIQNNNGNNIQQYIQEELDDELEDEIQKLSKTVILKDNNLQNFLLSQQELWKDFCLITNAKSEQEITSLQLDNIFLSYENKQYNDHSDMHNHHINIIHNPNQPCCGQVKEHKGHLFIEQITLIDNQQKPVYLSYNNTQNQQQKQQQQQQDGVEEESGNNSVLKNNEILIYSTQFFQNKNQFFTDHIIDLSTLNVILSQNYEKQVLKNSDTYSNYCLMVLNTEELKEYYDNQILNLIKDQLNQNNIILKFEITQKQKQVNNVNNYYSSQNINSQYQQQQQQQDYQNNSQNIQLEQQQQQQNNDEIRSEYDGNNDSFDVPIKLITETKVVIDLNIKSLTLRLGDFEFRFLKNILDIVDTVQLQQQLQQQQGIQNIPDSPMKPKNKSGNSLYNKSDKINCSNNNIKNSGYSKKQLKSFQFSNHSLPNGSDNILAEDQEKHQELSIDFTTSIKQVSLDIFPIKQIYDEKKQEAVLTYDKTRSYISLDNISLKVQDSEIKNIFIQKINLKLLQFNDNNINLNPNILQIDVQKLGFCDILLIKDLEIILGKVNKQEQKDPGSDHNLQQQYKQSTLYNNNNNESKYIKNNNGFYSQSQLSYSELKNIQKNNNLQQQKIQSFKIQIKVKSIDATFCKDSLEAMAKNAMLSISLLQNSFQEEDIHDIYIENDPEIIYQHDSVKDIQKNDKKKLEQEKQNKEVKPNQDQNQLQQQEENQVQSNQEQKQPVQKNSMQEEEDDFTIVDNKRPKEFEPLQYGKLQKLWEFHKNQKYILNVIELQIDTTQLTIFQGEDFHFQQNNIKETLLDDGQTVLIEEEDYSDNYLKQNSITTKQNQQNHQDLKSNFKELLDVKNVERNYFKKEEENIQKKDNNKIKYQQFLFNQNIRRNINPRNYHSQLVLTLDYFNCFISQQQDQEQNQGEQNEQKQLRQQYQQRISMMLYDLKLSQNLDNNQHKLILHKQSQENNSNKNILVIDFSTDSQVNDMAELSVFVSDLQLNGNIDLHNFIKEFLNLDFDQLKDIQNVSQIRKSQLNNNNNNKLNQSQSNFSISQVYKPQQQQQASNNNEQQQQDINQDNNPSNNNIQQQQEQSQQQDQGLIFSYLNIPKFKILVKLDLLVDNIVDNADITFPELKYQKFENPISQSQLLKEINQNFQLSNILLEVMQRTFFIRNITNLIKGISGIIYFPYYNFLHAQGVHKFNIIPGIAQGVKQFSKSVTEESQNLISSVVNVLGTLKSGVRSAKKFIYKPK